MADWLLLMSEAATPFVGDRCSLESLGLVVWARASSSADELLSSDAEACRCCVLHQLALRLKT